MIHTTLFSFLIAITILSPSMLHSARATRLGVFPESHSPTKKQRLMPPTPELFALSAPSHLTHSPFKLDQTQETFTSDDYTQPNYFSNCPAFLAKIRKHLRQPPSCFDDETEFTNPETRADRNRQLKRIMHEFYVTSGETPE